MVSNLITSNEAVRESLKMCNTIIQPSGASALYVRYYSSEQRIFNGFVIGILQATYSAMNVSINCVISRETLSFVDKIATGWIHGFEVVRGCFAFD